MNPVPLPSTIYDPLRRIAQTKGQQVENIVVDVLEGYLHEYRLQQLTEEMERYRAQHVTLLPLYLGQFIGMYNGKVVGHGQDGGQLYYRLRQEYGDLPILIVAVTETPEQEFTIRTPHLETMP